MSQLRAQLSQMSIVRIPYRNNRASSGKIKLQQLNEHKTTGKTFRVYLICKALTLLLWGNMVASLRECRMEGCTRAIFTALLGNETSYMPFHECTLPFFRSFNSFNSRICTHSRLFHFRNTMTRGGSIKVIKLIWNFEGMWGVWPHEKYSARKGTSSIKNNF